jgi:hypothetical protein
MITHVDLTRPPWLQLANNIDVVDNQFSAVFDPALIPVSPARRVTFRADYVSSRRGAAISRNRSRPFADG